MNNIKDHEIENNSNAKNELGALLVIFNIRLYLCQKLYCILAICSQFFFIVNTFVISLIPCSTKYDIYLKILYCGI